MNELQYSIETEIMINFSHKQHSRLPKIGLHSSLDNMILYFNESNIK